MNICPFLRDNLLRNRDSSSARTVSPRSNKDTERARDPERIVASLQVQTQQPIKSASYAHTCFSREAMPGRTTNLLLAFHHHYTITIVTESFGMSESNVHPCSIHSDADIVLSSNDRQYSVSRTPHHSQAHVGFFFQANAPDSTRFV